MSLYQSNFKNVINIYFLFFFVLPFQIEEGVLYWRREAKLQFEDFKGDIPSNSIFDATSTISFYINYYDDLNLLIFTVKPYFEKDLSWIKSDGKNLLMHEQGHFDISEYKARLIRKYFYNVNKKSYSEEKIKENFGLINIEAQKRDSTYDMETNYGLDSLMQIKWNIKISKILDSLKAYEKPEGTVILK